MLAHYEIATLRMIRRHTAHPVLVRGARIASFFGEHALGWIVLGTLAGLLDAAHRPVLFSVAVAAVAAHGAAIVIKRVVRRPRPSATDLPALCSTPSRLSFPSAHACSTTAAAIALVPIVGVPVAAAIIGLMCFSRLLLGVHYPTDVLAGVAVGACAAMATGQFTL